MSADLPRIHETLDWARLSPADGHYAFGYYDRFAWDPVGEKHLALHLPQQERLPAPGETAELGYVERAGGKFHRLTETRAWCHQQGCMSLWLPHRPGSFVYNDFEKEGQTWRLKAKIYEFGRGVVGEFARPIYAQSADGRWGVSLNFGRIPRRGYSYALCPVPENEPLPPDLDAEGLFLSDLKSGATRLIASYRQLLAVHPFPYDLEDAYVWLNHAIFNCDGSRVMVLLRHCPRTEVSAIKGWKTHMLTMNLDGSELICSLSDVYWQGKISHQIWGRTPREILVDANWCNRGHEHVVFQEDRRPLIATRLSPGRGPAAHLVFSPDGRWLLADSYPDRDGRQHLLLVRVADGEWREIGTFRHEAPGRPVDVRCDLHPRWSRDGQLITVDSIHAGPRSIFGLETAAALKVCGFA